MQKIPSSIYKGVLGVFILDFCHPHVYTKTAGEEGRRLKSKDRDLSFSDRVL